MKKIIACGASDSAVKRCIKNIDFNQCEIIAFLDNDIKKQGNIINKFPFINASVIGMENLYTYEYDYIFLATLVYADEWLEQLLTANVEREKILLIYDESVWPVLLHPELFGNNFDNTALFTNQYYINYKKFIDLIWNGYDKENNIFKFLNLEFSDGFLLENAMDIFISEFRDLLQKYVIGHSIIPYNEGPYEFDHVFLEEGDIVFDCGANLGLFTSYASTKVTSGTVYAFEPFEYARKELEKNTLKLSNVHIVPIALSDQKSTASMSLNELGNSSIIINVSDNLTLVDTDTIDNIVETYGITNVNFIKADIEGAERNMLLGARNTIRKFTPKISICTYHLDDDKEMLEAIIKNIDKRYIVLHKWKKLYAYVPK